MDAANGCATKLRAVRAEPSCCNPTTVCGFRLRRIRRIAACAEVEAETVFATAVVVADEVDSSRAEADEVDVDGAEVEEVARDPWAMDCVAEASVVSDGSMIGQ